MFRFFFILFQFGLKKLFYSRKKREESIALNNWTIFLKKLMYLVSWVVVGGGADVGSGLKHNTFNHIW